MNPLISAIEKKGTGSVRCTWLNAGRHDRCCVNFAWFSYRSRSPGLVDHSNFAGDVGRAQLQEYFGRLRQLLRPGGLMLNHGITAGGLHNHQLGSGMGDFIEKYIFPGGELVNIGDVITQHAPTGRVDELDEPVDQAYPWRRAYIFAKK